MNSNPVAILLAIMTGIVSLLIMRSIRNFLRRRKNVVPQYTWDPDSIELYGGHDHRLEEIDDDDDDDPADDELDRYIKEQFER